jgi:hypothetical protein
VVAVTRTPLWVRAILASLLIGVPVFLVAEHLDRVHNEQRLARIASAIAHRPVHVRCPSPFKRMFSYEITEGTVRFDARGRPSDTTDIRAGACGELDALAEHGRGGVLACVERERAVPVLCGRPALALANAVNTITHESFHLRGIADESLTECHALEEMARTAERLGATPVRAEALATLERTELYPLMPAQYRTTPVC